MCASLSDLWCTGIWSNPNIDVDVEIYFRYVNKVKDLQEKWDSASKLPLDSRHTSNSFIQLLACVARVTCFGSQFLTRSLSHLSLCTHSVPPAWPGELLATQRSPSGSCAYRCHLRGSPAPASGLENPLPMGISPHFKVLSEIILLL